MSLLEEVKTLVLDGCNVEGEHHKQWYLEELLRKLNPIEAEFYESYKGFEGIPP
jgi:hypothetical protein